MECCIELTQATECCICLDYTNTNTCVLLCCNNELHDVCLAMVIASGHTKCPLCRKTIVIKKYFTEKSFYQILLQLNDDFLSMNNDTINKILYDLTDFNLRSLRLFCILHFKTIIFNMLCILLLIMFVYVEFQLYTF